MYPTTGKQFVAAIQASIGTRTAPPGKYRMCVWDNWELSSSGYTFEEAWEPAVVGDYDDPEEAVRIATEKTDKFRLEGMSWDMAETYGVYDDQGRYLGGDSYKDIKNPVPEARIEAYRRWRGRKEQMTTQGDPTRLTDRFREAFSMAFDLHGGQLRKGTKVPYISHPIGVASLVIENGGDEDEAIAALLHDTAEDQGGRETMKKILDRFGARVASIVDGCTDTYDDPKPSWKERKEAFLERLPWATPSVRLVASADKLHNARAVLADFRAIGEDIWKRFNAPKKDLLWYHRAVTEALKKAGPSSLVEELDRVVTELERLASAG
jgi:HD domain-containing protein